MTGPRLVAHRGRHGASGPRENTVDAIRAAVDWGADAVEIDVRVTRDGEVVLLHDADLRRLWGDPRAVAQLAAAEVREVGGGSHRIPTLADALDAMAGADAVLLIDMDHADPAAPAADIVLAHGAEHRTEWCGATDAMRIVRSRIPDAVIHQAWSSPDAPDREALAELRPAFVNAEHLRVEPSFVDAVHGCGARVACWTVDDGPQAAHLAAIGVDSITTNDLDAVRDRAADEDARRLAILEEIARHAAELTRQGRARGVGAVGTKKNPADHVTEIDLAVERAVRGVLAAQFPADEVVGEEYGGTSDGTSPCWYLDPVDGTANLANGVPWTSFSLALVVDGEPVAGVVLDPVGSVPIVAGRGLGAWRAGARLAVADPQGDPLVGRMVTTELAGAEPWDGLVPLLDRLARRHCTLRIPGSGTASLTGPALGRGVAALVHRYSAIDHAAALLIVREAGGVARRLPGGAALTAVSVQVADALEALLDPPAQAAASTASRIV